jgi:hypothetical protein
LPLDAVMLNTLPSEPYGGWNLDYEKATTMLRVFIEGERPGLIVIDTLWRATSKQLYREEQVNEIASPLIDIAQTYETAIVALMHLSKDSETLGRRLEGMATSVLKLTRPDPSQPNRRKLECKGNHKEPAPLGITFREGGCDYDGDPPEVEGDDRRIRLMTQKISL